MKLKEALELSAVEHSLDNSSEDIGAKRIFTSGVASAGAAVTKNNRRYLVALSMTEFKIVWADTMKPISENLRFYERDFNSIKLLDKDDWEPL